MTNRVLITTSTFGKEEPSIIKPLYDAGCGVILNPYGRKLSEEEVLSLLLDVKPVAMIAGVEPLTRDVLKKAKSLKIITRCGIGLDSVDLEAASELGITVTNTPDAPTISVAELTLGMILGLLRQLHTVDAGIRQEKWERPMGTLLYGKTVGIVGCGRIGTYVARLVLAFNCRVLGHDPYLERHDYCELVSLGELLAQSDVVALHIPYSKENHYFIKAKQLVAMKPGAILVNTARGGLVDEQALYEALESGHLGGAALDCFAEEPYTGPLRNLNNVMLTAHIGSYAREARVLMEQQAVDNLLRELCKSGGD